MRLFIVFLSLFFIQIKFLGAALAEDVPSRIVPIESTSKLLPGSAIYFGAFDETLQYRTARRYRGAGAGLSLGFFQHIHGMWNGALMVQFSKWEGKDFDSPQPTSLEKVAPLSFSSIVEASPSPVSLLGDWSRNIRGLLFGGLGYVQFYKDQTIPTWRSKLESSEMTFSIGAGVKYSIPAGMAFRASVDRWRSLRSFRYSAYRVSLGLLAGDTTGW